MTVRGHPRCWLKRADANPVSNAIRELLDHLGASPQNGRDRETKHFSRFDINDEFEFRGLLDRHIGGLFPLQDSAGVDTKLPEVAGRVGSVSHQMRSQSFL